MALDPNLIGSVINALPMDKMIAGPLNAMISAQVSASRQYADFLLNVCIRDGKALQVQFEYDETQTDTQGNVVGVVAKTMRVPLLAVITHPNINVEEGSVDFELEVSQSEADSSKTGVDASLEASAGWGPFSVKITAKVTHSSEQTRKTDTRAKYKFHTSLKRSGPPEGMMRVIDFLTEAATKPVMLPDDMKDKMKDPKPLAAKTNGGTTK